MINKDYGLTGIFKWVKERIVRGVEITLILYDAWDGDTNTYFTNILGSRYYLFGKMEVSSLN